MNSPGNKTMIGSAALFALLMLVSTGCTKEEVVAPNAPVPVLQTRASANGGNSTLGPGVEGSDSSAPISDDGDDLGDSERSNRPRN